MDVRPSPTQRQVIALHERGLNAEQIAMRLNRNVENVVVALYRGGYGPPDALQYISKGRRERRIRTLLKWRQSHVEKIEDIDKEIAELRKTTGDANAQHHG